MNGLGFRRLARVGVLGLPCLGLACAETSEYRSRVPAPYGAIAPAVSPVPTPAGDDAFRVRLASEPTTVDAAQRQAMPIGLDTVLRLAEEQNPQIKVALSKVCASFADKELADANWLPDIYLGVGYWRHEGGIQLQEGPLLHSSTQSLLNGAQLNATYNPRDRAYRQLTAARKIWQDHGDLTKITTEQLLESSTTYIDLLAANSALAISQDQEKHVKPLQDKVKRLIENFPNSSAVKTELLRIEAELQTQQQTQQNLQAKIEAASAKLAYLLGLDSSVHVVPLDGQMAAFHIVDASAPVDQLVAQALANGPGVRELEGILSVIQQGMDQARGPTRLLPTIDVQMGEGLFAAGPGGSLLWDNRWDMGIQARWRINDLCQAEKKRQVGFAQINQVSLTYQDLRAKLTLGVQESRATILSHATQLTGAEDLIKKAKQVLEYTEKRSGIDPLQGGATQGEVMLAHRSVALAQLNYLELMREFDKAQLRLMILLGPDARPASAPTPTPADCRIPPERNNKQSSKL